MSIMNMFKSLSSKLENFLGEISSTRRWNFGSLKLMIFFIILTDGSTCSTFKHDVSDKDILCNGHILSVFIDKI